MGAVGNTKRMSLVIASFVMGASLVACDDPRTDAESAAAKLADAVQIQDVSSVPFEGLESAAVNTELQSIFKALEPAKPTIDVGELTLEQDTAKVPLNYTWDIGGTQWKYTVSARLAKSENEWVTTWSPELLVAGLQDGEVLRRATIAPPRADILGADDAPIVTTRDVVNVGIDKTRLGSADAVDSATQLAMLVEVDPAAFSAQVSAAGPEAFVAAITLREEGRTITDEQVNAIPGGFTTTEKLPLAPSRTFARGILGTVNPVNSEQIEASGGGLLQGDLTGNGGLQQQYDERLRGVDGLEISAETPESGESGPAPRPLFSTPPVPGEPLRTTLDLGLQELAEKTLADVGPASALVAVRPSTGAVLAAASGPGSNGYNTAMLGQYAPGSTFKIVDSLAMIRNGATPETIVQCTPTLNVEGRTFKNAEGYPEGSLGDVTLRDAFAHSCNTAFIAARDSVTQEQLESAATSLGVAIEAPKLGAEAFLGSVPGQAEGTEHAASMIGQGKVLVSPLSAAVMAASVAKGATVSPQLVTNPETTSRSAAPSASASPSVSRSPEPSTVASPQPTATGPVSPVTAAESAAIGDMMRAVVTSGHAGFLEAVPGAPVQAKTGTAEFGNDTPPKTHAWIVAIHGDLAVAVFVEEGGLGATTSGPLLQSFLTAAG